MEDSGKRKIGRRLLRWGGALLHGVFVAVSVVVAAGLLLSYLAPWVNPNRFVWLSFLGLAAPFIYGVNFLLMLFWTICWRRMAWLSFAVFLLGVGSVGKYFRPSWEKEYAQVRDGEALRVLSYNVGGFWGDQSGEPASQMRNIVEYVLHEDPDVICFQEFEVNHVNHRSLFDSLMDKWPHKAVFFTKKLSGNDGWGLAVYSKYPILSRERLAFHESQNSAMRVDLLVHKDTIRLFNAHLQTTQIDEKDRRFLRSEPLADTLLNDKTRSIVRKLKRNFMKRAEQADSLAVKIHDGTPRVILCGDFNDTPTSYTYRRMRGDFTDAFTQKGRGMVFTYKRLLGVLRIDYLFHSRDFETVGYRSEQPLWSDHNPVIVDLKLKRH